MKARNSEHAGFQDDDHGSAQIKCVSLMTYSQKLYQSQVEIAEEFNQAIDANSLEKIKNLLDKMIELD